MKLQAEIDGKPHQIQLERRDGLVLASIGDRSYSLEVRQASSGSMLLIHDSEIFECLVESDAGRQNEFQVYVRNRAYHVGIIDPKRLRSGEAAGGENHGSAKVLAVMPGKVVRVLVEIGSAVEAGAGIAVVEAMKMQNEIRAPKSGTVVTLNATPGATVNAGDVLAVIE